jgi:DNA-binding response OmpR family regulator
VEWIEISRHHPPRLHIDLATDRVFVGYGEVHDLQPGAYKLLRYLYEHRPRTCSRSELYYRAHLGLDHEPRSHEDREWEDPTKWGGIVDTHLWRLRQKIERDPKRPLYIISERGRGVHLEHIW